MTSGTSTIDRRGADTSAVSPAGAVLADVLAWCELHITTDPDEGETWGDVPVQLGGAGCPWIQEFTITELAAGLDQSLPSARALVSDVLELAFRLPGLWARVQAGEVPAWRACRVAEQTCVLCPEAAGFVDAQVGPFAERVGAAAVERAVQDAITRFMPDLAEQRRAEAAEQRHLDIGHRQASGTGLSTVEGVLDTADALDLDTVLAQLAAELKEGRDALPAPLPSRGVVDGGPRQPDPDPRDHDRLAQRPR